MEVEDFRRYSKKRDVASVDVKCSDRKEGKEMETKNVNERQSEARSDQRKALVRCSSCKTSHAVLSQ